MFRHNGWWRENRFDGYRDRYYSEDFDDDFDFNSGYGSGSRWPNNYNVMMWAS